MLAEPDLKKILLAYDGSEPARKALSYACKIAKLCGGTVRAVYVVSVPIALEGALFVNVEKALREHGEELLAEAKKEAAERYGIEIETIVLTGHPADKIIEEAERWGADLIVMGTRGLSGFKRLLLGSVSDAVAKHAPCPVLLVR